MELINQVNLKKAEIKCAERPKYLTNCSFAWDDEGGSKRVNLHVEKDVGKLISIAAFIKRKQLDYQDLAKDLGVDSPPQFKWAGFTADDWLADIKLRINKIHIVEKKASLERLEERLNKIISPDLRAKMELEAIEKELA